MTLVFDFGKVVFAWEPHRMLMRVLPGHAPDEPTARALEADFFQDFKGDWAEFDRGTLSEDVLATRIAVRTGLSADDARMAIDAVPDELAPMPGIVGLLERLHAAGSGLYFLSNMPPAYADALDARHAFLRLFRDGVFSGRVHLVKPEPAIFTLAATRFGIDPADALLIDDVPANVEAARAAGWQGLQFVDVAQCEAALQRLAVF